MENYDECYHCPRIHPELCRVSPPESGNSNAPQRGAFVGGPMDLVPHAVTMSMDGKSGGVHDPGPDRAPCCARSTTTPSSPTCS